nr:MAG TPA: hypothetical protein [Caudoviricetes sp.]
MITQAIIIFGLPILLVSTLYCINKEWFSDGQE